MRFLYPPQHAVALLQTIVAKFKPDVRMPERQPGVPDASVAPGALVLILPLRPRRKAPAHIV